MLKRRWLGRGLGDQGAHSEHDSAAHDIGALGIPLAGHGNSNFVPDTLNGCADAELKDDISQLPSVENEMQDAGRPQDRKRRTYDMRDEAGRAEKEYQDYLIAVQKLDDARAKAPALEDLKGTVETLTSELETVRKEQRKVTVAEKVLNDLKAKLAAKPSEKTLLDETSAVRSELAERGKIESSLRAQKKELRAFCGLKEKELRQMLDITNANARLSALEVDAKVLTELRADVTKLKQAMKDEPSKEELTHALAKAKEVLSEIRQLKADELSLVEAKEAELRRLETQRHELSAMKSRLNRGPTLCELEDMLAAAKSQQAVRDDLELKLNEMKRVEKLVQANEALTGENKSLQDQLEEAKKAIGFFNGSDWLASLSVVGKGQRFRTAVANQDSEATAPAHYIDPAYVDKLMTDHATLETILQVQGWQLEDVRTKADVLERLTFHQDLWNIIDCMLQDDPLATVITHTLVRRTLISMTKDAFKEKQLMDSIPSCRSNLRFLIWYAYGCNVEVDKQNEDSEMRLITDNVDAVDEYMARNGGDSNDYVERRRILVEMGDHELDPNRPWRDRALVNEIQFRGRVKRLCEFYQDVWHHVNHQALADSIYAHAGKKCLVHHLMCDCFSKLDNFIEMHYERTFKN